MDSAIWGGGPARPGRAVISKRRLSFVHNDVRVVAVAKRNFHNGTASSKSPNRLYPECIDPSRRRKRTLVRNYRSRDMASEVLCPS